MRKPMVWFLAMLAPLLILAVMAWDAHQIRVSREFQEMRIEEEDARHRVELSLRLYEAQEVNEKAQQIAELALQRHETRMAKELAGLRVRLHNSQRKLRDSILHRCALDFFRSKGTSDPSGEFDWLNKVMHPNPEAAQWQLTNWCDSGLFYPYEDGGSKCTLAIWASWAEADYSSPDRVLVALGTLFEFELAGSALWPACSRRLSDETTILARWSDMLKGRTLPADELQRMAAELDRLWSGRPDLLDAMVFEYAIFSQSLILQIRHPDRRGFSTDHELAIMPSVKYPHSRKIAAVRMLDEFEEDLRGLKERAQLPLWEQTASIFAGAKGRSWNHAGVNREDAKLHDQETSAQLSWTLARVATAVARFRAEQGEFPDALDALVPRYLSRVPECPKTGRALLYHPGEVSAPGDPKRLWSVKRK